MYENRKRNVPRWRGGEDWRVVCSCQLHAAAKPTVVRRALRLAARGAAVLVSIPLAFAAFDIPSFAAMSLKDLRAMQIAEPAKMRVQTSAAMPIFTSKSVREQFLNPAPAPVTMEVFKENYFRSHVPFGAIIYREARRNELPPELVAAMVQTESDFRPRLVSNKSAQGLMQIVPSTAALLGVDDPFDPQKNIAAGTKYFRYLLNRFDDETMALAAYNAGEGNVARFGGVPPFTETRDYISKVNRRTRRYRDSYRNSYIASVRIRRDAH
jgi:soluble lytic murein transglycosylase-like protein